MSLADRIRELKREAIRRETVHDWAGVEVVQAQISALELCRVPMPQAA